MNCEGQGVASSSSRRSGGGAAAAAGSSSGMDPTMMNVWGDFMSEEMDDVATQPAVAATASMTASAAAASATSSSVPTASAATSGPRNYILPIQPRMRLIVDGKKPNKKNGASSNGEDDTADGYYDVPKPGLLAQTGTLDSSV